MLIGNYLENLIKSHHRSRVSSILFGRSKDRRSRRDNQAKGDFRE
jgi:hypothetical protein